jgi:hypothetical protein
MTRKERKLAAENKKAGVVQDFISTFDRYPELSVKARLLKVADLAQNLCKQHPQEKSIVDEAFNAALERLKEQVANLTKKEEDSVKLTPEQIANWRLVLMSDFQIGPYAMIAPDHEIQAIRDNIQKHLNT